MSFKVNLSDKNPLLKPVAILVIIAAVIGIGFLFFDKNSDSDNEFGEANPSGISASKKVKNVGDVEEVIAAWIEANPEAILQSVSNMQKKAIAKQAKDAQKNIGSKKSEIFSDKSPSYAPKNYDVTIVEFYDYNCGYCKRANASVEELLKTDKKVRVIYKDFPILGKTSEELAKVSIAANMVSKKSFRKFHNKLMSSNASSKSEAIAIAGQIGINVARIEKILNTKNDEIMAIINANREVGSSIGIQGTPAFVIGEELIPGAVDAKTLKAKIDAVR